MDMRLGTTFLAKNVTGFMCEREWSTYIEI